MVALCVCVCQENVKKKKKKKKKTKTKRSGSFGMRQRDPSVPGVRRLFGDESEMNDLGNENIKKNKEIKSGVTNQNNSKEYSNQQQHNRFPSVGGVKLLFLSENDSSVNDTATDDETDNKTQS